MMLERVLKIRSTLKKKKKKIKRKGRMGWVSESERMWERMKNIVEKR